MSGIWVAVNATTSTPASSRNTVLKLWKSRPAAPMITTRMGKRPPRPPAGIIRAPLRARQTRLTGPGGAGIIAAHEDQRPAARGGRGAPHGARPQGAPTPRQRHLPLALPGEPVGARRVGDLVCRLLLEKKKQSPPQGRRCRPTGRGRVAAP